MLHEIGGLDGYHTPWFNVHKFTQGYFLAS